MFEQNQPKCDPESRNRASQLVVSALTLATAFFSGGCSTRSDGPEPGAPAAQTATDQAVSRAGVTKEQVLPELREIFQNPEFGQDSIRQGGYSGQHLIYGKLGEVTFHGNGEEGLTYNRRIHINEPMMLPSPTEPGVLLGNPRYHEKATHYISAKDAAEFVPAITKAHQERRQLALDTYKADLADIEKKLPHFMIEPERRAGGLTRIEAERPSSYHGDAKLVIERLEGELVTRYRAVASLRLDSREGELLDIRELDSGLAERLYRIAESQNRLEAKRDGLYNGLTPSDLYEGKLSRDEKNGALIFERGELKVQIRHHDRFGASADVSIDGNPWIRTFCDARARELFETGTFILRQREKN